MLLTTTTSGAYPHDDRRLFEMLLLEGAQAGLSWLTILRSGAYRRAFDGFDVERVAAYQKPRSSACWPIRASSATGLR